MNRRPRRPLQVSLRVAQPSVVELTVGDTVQLDRLTPSPHGNLPERHGSLLRPGATTLHLDQGHYFFKTLTEAHLKVVSGGVEATEIDDPKDPWPPPPPPGGGIIALVPGGKGDEPVGEAPALVVEHAQEAQS